MSVTQNLLHIKQSLPAHVTLVAVSKTKPDALISEAYAAGQRDFGENYVQEVCDKQTRLLHDIHWHFIGHLQSNKVKYLAPFVYLIHGVDSFKLLQEINKQALKNGRVISCLLQVYIATEESKFGFNAEELLLCLNSDAFSQLKNIKVCGLMGMATNTEDKELIRKEFATLKSCFDACLNQVPASANLELKILSMGMSSDYEMAIQEGSTLVRIGSSIFGERHYPNA